VLNTWHANSTFRGVVRRAAADARLLGCCAIIIAVLVFRNALANEYALDDIAIVQLNPIVHSLENLRAILLGSYWPNSRELYRPVVLFSFALDHQIFGPSTVALHAVNLVLHAVVTGLLFLLCIRLGATALAAFAASVIFAVHPVHVEAVANLVGRAELLAAAFVLLGCCVHLSRSTPAWIRIGGVALCYGMGLGAKEIAVTMPLLLLVLDGVRENNASPRIVHHARKLLPVWVSMGVVLLVYLALRRHVLGSGVGTQTAPYLVDLGTWDRLATAVSLWPEYLRLMLWPQRLSMDWGPALIEPATWASSNAWLGLALGIALALLAIRLWRDSRWIPLGIAWFAIVVFPVSHIPFSVGVLIAERTLYLPSVGMSFIVVGFVTAAAASKPPIRTFVFALIAALCVLGGIRTWTRTPVWASTNALFDSMVEEHPESYFVRWRAGSLLKVAGRYEEAVPWFEDAMRLTRYNHYDMSIEFASVLTAIGRTQESRSILERQTERNPDAVPAFVFLAQLHFDEHRFDLAIETARRGEAVERFGAQGIPMLSHIAALSFDALQQPDSALARQHRAIEFDPASGGMGNWYHLARVHQQLGRRDLADAALQRARQLAPAEQVDLLTLDPLPDLHSRLLVGWPPPGTSTEGLRPVVDPGPVIPAALP
jgi:protein O-mannosyl-transferase